MSFNKLANISPSLLDINKLWYSQDPRAWDEALERYWQFVQPANLVLEHELEKLQPDFLRQLDSEGWYDFLLNKYFHWKYTANNRYATTTGHLKWYSEHGKLDELHQIKQELLALETSTDIKQGLEAACKIRGLGTAGASGLLSLIYPRTFATVDQFVVKALRGVSDLPEAIILGKMKVDALSIKHGVILIDIMQRKAAENNLTFGTTDWTPRRIDKILWTFGR